MFDIIFNMKKSYLAICIVVISLLATTRIFWRPKSSNIHFHAGFLVYADGALQNFSETKYMKIEPCNAKGSVVHEDEQLEKAHLHNGVGDVVHVHRSGAIWNDLFKNIRYASPEKTAIKGFENGKEIPNFLSSPIKPYESVIIIQGDASGIELSKFVTKDHIIEVEKKVETCGL